MGSTRFMGIVLLLGGAIVLGMAYQQPGTVADQLKHLFSGGYWDTTTWMIVIGGLATILGLVGTFLPTRHVHVLSRVFHRRQTRVVVPGNGRTV